MIAIQNNLLETFDSQKISNSVWSEKKNFRIKTKFYNQCGFKIQTALKAQQHFSLVQTWCKSQTRLVPLVRIFFRSQAINQFLLPFCEALNEIGFDCHRRSTSAGTTKHLLTGWGAKRLPTMKSPPGKKSKQSIIGREWSGSSLGFFARRNPARS